MKLTSDALNDELKGWVKHVEKFKFYDQAGEPAGGDSIEVDVDDISYDRGGEEATITSVVYTAADDFDMQHCRLLDGNGTYVEDVNGDDFDFANLEAGKKYKFTHVIGVRPDPELCSPQESTGTVEEVP